MKKKNVMICLDETVIMKAKKLAKKEGRSFSGLIGWLIMTAKIIIITLLAVNCRNKSTNHVEGNYIKDSANVGVVVSDSCNTVENNTIVGKPDSIFHKQKK